MQRLHNTLHTPELKLYRNFARFHEPTHHFVCLNRALAWQRAKLVELLLDQDLDQYGAISYGVNLTQSDLKFLGSYATDHLMFPLKYQHRLPLLVDQAGVTIQQGFSVAHPQIRGAFFNVITETGYGVHPELPDSRKSVQYPSLTEKTYKCFILGQVPIWLSAQHTVHWARELGFDVFDDIVNHDYDLESDPAARVPMVAAEVRRVCEKYSVAELVSLHHAMIPRLKNNYRVLCGWAKGHDCDVPRWAEYFRQMGMIQDAYTSVAISGNHGDSGM